MTCLRYMGVVFERNWRDPIISLLKSHHCKSYRLLFFLPSSLQPSILARHRSLRRSPVNRTSSFLLSSQTIPSKGGVVIGVLESVKSRKPEKHARKTRSTHNASTTPLIVQPPYSQLLTIFSPEVKISTLHSQLLPTCRPYSRPPRPSKKRLHMGRTPSYSKGQVKDSPL